MPVDSSVTASTASHAANVRWREHNSARQHRILDAALLLLDRSPAGKAITMGDVAREAKLAKSVVYRQFDGRDNLLAWMRTQITEMFYATVTSQLDLRNRTVFEMLNGTIGAIAVFMRDHPRWIDLSRNGPRHDDPATVSALSSLRQRLASRARDTLGQLALAVGIEPTTFRLIPAAAAAMNDGLLHDWLTDPLSTKSMADVVSDLSDLTWFLLEGAARRAGHEVDPNLRIPDPTIELGGTSLGEQATVAEPPL